MRVERDFPITVYDVEDKKVVMIFETVHLCQKYIYDKSNGITGNIYQYLERKSKMKTNRFSRTICFRRSNEQQIETLGSDNFKILDERFDIKCNSKLESGFYTTRTDLYNNQNLIPNGHAPVSPCNHYKK